MKGRTKVLALATGVVTAITTVPLAITGKVYEKHLDKRVETPKYRCFKMDDFPGLQREPHLFRSQQNCVLSGYLYYRGEEEPKAVIVFAHGIGTGHVAYMDIINYFTEKDFAVFAYDTSGFDESEGTIRGLQQTVDDLDRAITLAKNIEKVKGKPVLLFGHSWGAYSVTHVLAFHPEVKGVIALAGFDRNRDIISYYGRSVAGDLTKAVIPYACVYDRMKFGKYHDTSAVTIFKNTDAYVMAVTGDRDNLVPERFGYDIWKNQFYGSDNFRFVKRRNRGHGTLYYTDEATEYLLELYDKLEESLSCKLDDKNRKKYSNEIEDFYDKNLDREIYTNMIDLEFAGEMRDFYNKAIDRSV